MASWNPISEHRRTGRGLLQTTWPQLVLGGMCLGFALMFLLLWFKQPERTDMIIASCVMVLLAAALLAVAPWRWFRAASVVRVYQEGLQWRQGGSERQRTWEEVREVYRKEEHLLQNNARPSDWNRRSDLRLIFTDGEQVRFNHTLSDYNRLAEYVQEATAAHLLPGARAALSGSGIAFGTLQLNREGLTLGRDVFPWETLSKVWVGNGILGWHDTRGHTRSIALKELPNYPVILRLMDERRRSVGG